MFIFTQAINFCFVNRNFDDYVARYLVYDVIIVKDILMIHKLSLLLASELVCGGCG